jgi:Icc-related predicted phosphoesterase
MSESERRKRGDGAAPSGEERRSGDRRRADRRQQTVRIAAVGDFHTGEEDAGAYRALFARVNDEADVLVIAGDLTRWGTPAEMRVAVNELAGVEIPIVAVLGNHDCESGMEAELCGILRERGIHVLDGESYILNDQVGIAGVKGFMGGFGRRALTAFGEGPIKEFVGASLHEVQKLELALRSLHTPIRIALLHYAPIMETVMGEPEQIFPFLGSDRLAEPLDRYEVAACFHGHAHIGTFEGKTPGGVPVYNVSHALLQREDKGEMYFLLELPVPEPDDDENEPAAKSGSMSV